MKKTFLSEIHPSQWSLSLAMGFYFFLVITTFWILKPIKKAIFIGYYKAHTFHGLGLTFKAAQVELLAKVANMLVAIVAMTFFIWISRKLIREKLTYVFAAFIALCLIFFIPFLEKDSAWIAWSIYLFGDFYSTVMVATFFAFLNDSVSTDTARKLYGFIGFGGVAGGAFGSTFVRVWVKTWPAHYWMLMALGTTALIVVLAYFASRWTETKEEMLKESPQSPPIFEGAKVVFQSSYLLSILAIVVLYEVISTILDFQFTSTVTHFVAKTDLGTHFSSVFALTNWLSLIIQLFFTPWILTRFGVTRALWILPIGILATSMGFIFFPILWIGSALSMVDNGLNYSINQSAKEALYVPVPTTLKYKAKAFIDIFGQRFAKALGVGLSLLITMVFTQFLTLRWLSLVVLILSVLWLMTIWHIHQIYPKDEGSNSHL